MSSGGRIVCVCGPTASGKTAVGAALALELGAEVVSADSMQIYRGMDIGTAKPEEKEKMGVPHHMLDIVDPTEAYSCARYAQEARSCIEGIRSRGRLPVIVGGTGLYFDALLKSDDFAPEPDPEIRKELVALAQERGNEALFSLLREHDPASAEALHINDRKRVIRALEVKLGTGMTISEHNERSRILPPRYEAVMIGLDFEHRHALYERIDRRVDAMLARGLIQEVRRLLDSEIRPSCTSMQAIGYKEIVAYLRGERSLREASEAIKQGTRRYAKRQLTWFRKYPQMRWILQPDIPDFEEVRRLSTQYAL